MAVVRLSDAFVYDVYMGYTSLDDPEKSVLMQSGIVQSNDLMNQIARGGGKLSTFPFWKDLDPNIEPNYSNDDPDDKAVPNKLGSGEMTARKAFMNQGYSAMDLVAELTASDPMQRIRNRFGTYWMRQFERRVFATMAGILADNVANDAGDMQIDISGLSGDDAKFGSDAFIDAAYTAGDDADQFRAIGVHSSIEARMLKNDEIVYMPDSEGGLTIPTYKGRAVITSDMFPVTGTGADRVYTSVLFGAGGFGFGNADGSCFAVGEGVPQVPAEVERDATAGNGGGQETIWERKTWMLQPFGFTWKELTGGSAITEFSPTLANLREGIRWDRVVSRKQAPFAFIKSKA